jgi:hypothetical protein
MKRYSEKALQVSIEFELLTPQRAVGSNPISKCGLSLLSGKSGTALSA